MAASSEMLRALRKRLAINRVLIALALAAIGVSIGLWWWNSRTGGHRLRLAAGVELMSRKGLVDSLVKEAAERNLQIEIQRRVRSADALEMVARHEIDAAVVPAGLSYQSEEIRQVAVFDRQPLQLFVRPDLLPQGIGGLRGKRINLGSPGSGVQVIARDVLAFVGLKAGEHYTEEGYSFPELIALPPEQMPDAVFALSPLPSPLGERLARVYGYQLLELPFGAAMALRRPSIEDTVVPAYSYGTWPPVPDRPLHTLGVRGLLVAHAGASPAAIRRLLHVLYESELANRAGMPPLDGSLVQRSGEYPYHTGTLAYVHRNESWLNKDLIERLKELRGMAVSAVSAALLFWQWYRRRGIGGPSDYLQACAGLELEARRALYDGLLDQACIDACLARVVKLRLEVLENHKAGLLPADAMLATVLSRLDYLQETLGTLLPPSGSADLGPPSLPSARRAA